MADLQRRQDNLIAQLEEQQPTGDAEADREYRTSIQGRFTALVAEQRTRREELDHLSVANLQPAGSDPELLTRIPQISTGLAELPEALERQLYEAFHLQVRYNRPRHEVTIRVTIREDSVKDVTTTLKEIVDRPGEEKAADTDAGALFPSFVCPVRGTHNKGTPLYPF